jgi:hypothetical protein
MKKEVSHVSVERLQRYVHGASLTEIAHTEGVSVSAIRQSVHGAIGKAVYLARPDASLPEGAIWETNYHGVPYVSVARYDRNAAIWALAIIEDRAARCPTCDRPYS